MKKFTLIVFSVILLIGLMLGLSAAAAEESAQPVSVSFVQEYARVGDAFEVKLEGDASDCSVSWYVDGKAVGTGMSYTPVSDDLQKMITVNVSDKAGKLLCSKTVFCSKLPVLYIDTKDSAPIVSKETYLDAVITVQGNDKYNSENSTLYSGATEIKGRGNSTWLRFPKKPYRLKLDKKADMFGMGKNKHWALLANYIDDSLVRNSLAGEIAGQLGVLKMDSVPVEVVLNGKHLGNYILIEHVRAGSDRVDVFDWEGLAGDAAEAIAKKHDLDGDTEDELADYMEENMGWITSKSVKFNGFRFNLNDYLDEAVPEFDGGFLVEMDEQMDEVSSFYSKNKTPLMVKFPEYIKTDEAAYSYIQNYMNTVEDAFYSADHTIEQDGKRVSYTDLVDFDSLVSYWLTSEMLVNEAGFKSTYVHKELGEKLTFGPIWDFDYSSGGASPWSGQAAESWAVAKRKWFKGVITDPYFVVKSRELFLENESYFDNLVGKDGTLDLWYEYLHEAGLKNTEIWDYARGFEGDFSALKAWLTKRIAFFKKTLATDEAAAESFGVTFGGCDVAVEAESVLEKQGSSYYVNDNAVDKLTVSISNTDAVAYNYYVNSAYIGGGDITDAKAQFTVEKELLNEKAGKKNVIVIRLKNAEGKFTAVQMATVTLVPADSSFAVLTLTDGESEKQIKVLSGDRIYLDVSQQCGKENYFDGWSDGDIIYPEGTTYTVAKDTVLTAVYKLCSDSSAKHNFEINKDYDYTCSVCQITKPTDVKYKDVASLSFELKKRYGNKYTGKAVLPGLTVTDGTTTLKKDVHYKLTAQDNVDLGFATYTLTGMRSGGYDGSIMISFEIVRGSISKASGGVDTSITYYYTGSPITPVLKLNSKGIALKEGKDYTVSSIKNNVNIGTAKVTVKGKGNFSGSKTYSFKIVPAKVTGASVILSKNSYDYNGSYCKPTVTVKSADGKQFSASDYKVSYKNNLKAGTATVTVTFKGNYKGTVTKTFTILPVLGKKFSVAVKNAVYNGKVQTPSVTVKDSKGNALKKDTDYTLNYAEGRKVPGKYSVTITFKGNYSGTKTLYFNILPSKTSKIAITSATTAIKASWKKVTGATGYKVELLNSKGKAVKTVTTTKTSYTFKKLSKVTTYKIRVTAYKTIDKKAVYSTVSTTITTSTAPVKVTLSKVTAGSKSATATWKKVSGATGYEVMYSTSGKFSKSKTAAANKNSTVKLTIKKLTKGKKYYFRVRAYKTVDGNKIYGDWSAVKSVKL